MKRFGIPNFRRNLIFFSQYLALKNVRKNILEKITDIEQSKIFYQIGWRSAKQSASYQNQVLLFCIKFRREKPIHSNFFAAMKLYFFHQFDIIIS